MYYLALDGMESSGTCELVILFFVCVHVLSFYIDHPFFNLHPLSPPSSLSFLRSYSRIRSSQSDPFLHGMIRTVDVSVHFGTKQVCAYCYYWW